jgi:hypothetical protein
VEAAPGKVLTGLIRRINTDAETYSLDDSAQPGSLAVPTFIDEINQPVTGVTA